MNALIYVELINRENNIATVVVIDFPYEYEFENEFLPVFLVSFLFFHSFPCFFPFSSLVTRY